jgi:hypothetical protein
LLLAITYLYGVNSHRLKPVAFTATGFACPPYGGYFHPPVETGGIKIGIVKILNPKHNAQTPSTPHGNYA